MNLNKNHERYCEDINNILSVEGIDQLNEKSILITGATGLIGVHLIDVLMRMGTVKVYAVGRSKSRAKLRLGEYYSNPLFTFIEQDVSRPFPEDLMVDYIIPGASNTHPLAYSNYPIETIMTNVLGAKNALDLALRCGATVLYLSSVEVYGNAFSDEVFSEEYTGKLNLQTSRSCYTESKRVCEALCQSYLTESNVKVKIVRLSRVFGPTMLLADSKASSQFIKNALMKENIVLKSKGEQFFSYTYVSDAVSAMIFVMLHGECGQAYNISNEMCNVHLREFAQICADYNGMKVVFDLPSKEEMRGFSVASTAILDNSKLKTLGFHPIYNIRNAIYRTIDILT